MERYTHIVRARCEFVAVSQGYADVPPSGAAAVRRNRGFFTASLRGYRNNVKSEDRIVDLMKITSGLMG